MGDCSRNCKRMASIVVTESSSSSFSKKMRIGFSFEEMESLEDFDQLQAQRRHRRLFAVSSPEKAVSDSTTSSHSGGVLAGDISTADSAASRCSSNVSSEAVKDSFAFLDLEAKSFEIEGSTCINNKFSSRETTPSSEFCGDTNNMDEQEAKKHHRRNSAAAAAKTAPQEEIDEFFAAAEKEEQRRFADKYNYDIAKDAPLKGRYQWIRL